MRVLQAQEQEERKRRLLQAIIHHYIKTGKPVGSASLAEQYKLELSPATLRNIMAELEESGYLTHPHTSAGRVPTDRAYRYYVDSLIELQRLAVLEEEKIRTEYETRIREIEDLMHSTTRSLSALSNYTGFALAPAIEQSLLQHIQFVPLDNHRLLAVLVSNTGMVKHRVVAFEEPYDPDFVPELARTLNEHLRGKPFSHVRDTILDHIESVRQHQADVLKMARRVVQQAFDVSDDGELYLEGTGNILSLPDFQNQEQMRSLVHLLDEKRALGELIAGDLAAAREEARWPGVRVKIGGENLSPDLRNLSLISSTYTIGGRTVGVLGIIGPKRMEYSKMISLVGHVSRVLSNMLGRLTGE